MTPAEYRQAVEALAALFAAAWAQDTCPAHPRKATGLAGVSPCPPEQ